MIRYLNETEIYANNHKMKINTSKTKAMLFNSSHKFDFLPNLEFSNYQTLEVVEELRSRGVEEVLLYPVI